MRILVINGPNINMIGIREPDIYGKDTYEDLKENIYRKAEKSGDEIEIFQSNHEGAIIDKIQEAFGKFSGIVINAAGYTHTSVAIADALKAVSIPYVEVHISDILNREDFRKVSYLSEGALEVISGKGLIGYLMAIDSLKVLDCEIDD